MGTSKQSFHQKQNRWLNRKEEQAALIPLIQQIREAHPKMSARIMYKKLHVNTMGRDMFEAFCFENGFKVNRPKNYRKTTDSSGVEHFPNRIEGRELTGVNQVFVSDITYFELNGRFYYLTLIMDLYSREIVGFSESDSLRTTGTTLPALKMLARNIGSAQLEGSIFHSDGGGQYYDKEFLKLTKKLGMKNSMAKFVLENSHSERINGTIKNDYLIPYNPQNESELKRFLTKAVRNYNAEKPHSALGGMTPNEYRKNNTGKAMFIKKITTTIEVENNFPSYFPTSTVHQHQHDHL